MSHPVLTLVRCPRQCLGGKFSSPDRSRVPVSGGILVYEQRAVGRELVGFESVTDWDVLGDAVAALHLPELDETEDSR